MWVIISSSRLSKLSTRLTVPLSLSPPASSFSFFYFLGSRSAAITTVMSSSELLRLVDSYAHEEGEKSDAQHKIALLSVLPPFFSFLSLLECRFSFEDLRSSVFRRSIEMRQSCLP